MASAFADGLWRLADPKISLASFAGLFLAACMAAEDAEIAAGWLLLTVLAVFLVEVAKNAYGEVVDYDSGTDLAVEPGDRSPFSGGKRVLVDKLMNARQARAVAFVCYLGAIALGLVIVVLREPRALPFGVAGMALAWFYHGGALRLSYRGLGELAVAICYGPLIVVGCYLVQTGDVTGCVVHASIALGLLVAAFLWINQFPDHAADQASGKRNLVVRLGLRRASLPYVVILATGYLLLVFTALAYPGCRGLLWGLIGMPAAAYSALRLLAWGEDTPRLIPAQAACLASFVLMAAGAGLGYLLAYP
jgi:1,4-dihydroxy-2-naphthoate octaprenyltransferase